MPEVPVHSIKSMLGQHGAGSSMLQVVATCLGLRARPSRRRSTTIDPDPACGSLKVVTEPAMLAEAALVHSIGLGGFYYSVGAFKCVETPAAMQTGMAKVKWSAAGHRIFDPRMSSNGR